jgi:lysophospholipase L1-like esterase
MDKVRQTLVSTFDPLVGHCYSSNTELELADGEFIKDGLIWLGVDTGKRVFITGGSTSDLAYNGSWVRKFASFIRKHGFVTINSAVAGYSSVQEFLRLYRDGLSLRPKIVISLSGINDLGYIQASLNSPFVHHYQRHTLSSLLGLDPFALSRKVKALNGREVISGVNWGPKASDTSANFWAQNITLMNACCASIGADFHAFLQPLMGYGNYNLSVEESLHFDEYCEKNPSYFSSVVEFFESAEHYAENCTYIHSLTEIFDKRQNCYIDLRHPNDFGNAIIAREIYSTVI